MPIEQSTRNDSIVDVLELVLDKGVVIAGDIKVNIADVELLTIKIRLIVASVDKAKEIGMDWWESDPFLNSQAARKEVEDENRELKERLEKLEKSMSNDRTQIGENNK
ncbi:gas vesicle protein [Salimicrobium salexigens]|uniref:Gas vesicle protein n=1 Tax=Salimicrobium salexigens TaxID=908941 RepID=A0ABY1KRP4_9BACI|nr:gas vesicle protein [Salimicrobium salexigens]SIS69549.1 Gas vesicle protein [Salimicrobium salexigens]